MRVIELEGNAPEPVVREGALNAAYGDADVYYVPLATVLDNIHQVEDDKSKIRTIRIICKTEA